MTNSLTFTKHIEAPIAHVYHTFATKAGWLEWFAQKGSGSVGKNQMLQVFPEGGGHFALHFTDFQKHQTVAFTFIELDSLHGAATTVEFQEEDGAVAVTLTAETESQELLVLLQKLWEKSLTNLKSVVETGKDLTLWNRPFLGVTVAEWVSPELAEEKGLPAEHGLLLNDVFEGRGAEQAGMRKGDIIVTLDGVSIMDYETLTEVFSQHKAGDTIPVAYYQDGELVQSELTLSQFPVPKIPSNAQDLADRIGDFFDKVNGKIDQMLEGQSEAQFNYRPAGGEWSANEIIAHLIAGLADTVAWLGSYLAGRPANAYTSNVPARLKTILALNPTMEDLLQSFRYGQQELVTLISEIPAEISGRKSSLARLAYLITMDYSTHYKDHLSQLKETLAQAVDVRSI